MLFVAKDGSAATPPPAITLFEANILPEPETCNVYCGLLVFIPTLPELEINIRTEPLVSNARLLLSFVPNKACVPKLFPPWTNAFVLTVSTNDAVKAYEDVPNNEPVIPLDTVNEFKVASEPLITTFFQLGMITSFCI